MRNLELFDVLTRVILSWQVIAVTVAVLIFFAIVNNVTNMSKRPKFAASSKPKKLKRPDARPESDKNLDTSGLGIED
jgi:hypothetical protein